MHKLKKLKYAELSDYITKKYGDDFKNMPLTGDYNEDDMEYVEKDEYTEKDEDDNAEIEYNEDGSEKERKDIDIDNEEMGRVYDVEDSDNEDGDQDYGNLAVDDGDYD